MSKFAAINLMIWARMQIKNIPFIIFSFKSVQIPMQGAGVFNEPMADPRCLYEFYKVATERSEYELLRYCAKGYFYQGFDYNDDRAREMRKGRK